MQEIHRRFAGRTCGSSLRKKLAKLYKPPQIAGGLATRTPQHAPLWVVPLVREDWNEEDNHTYEKGEPVAKKKLKDEARFMINEFTSDNAWFRRDLRVGELILQVTTEADKRKMLTPVSRVILIRRYEVDGKEKMMVFLRTPKVRRKDLKAVKARIGKAWQLMRKLGTPRVVRDKAMAHALLQLWPTLPSIESL